jgi:4a-hydroxytetrahydrobiopterin dehydratase
MRIIRVWLSTLEPEHLMNEPISPMKFHDHEGVEDWRVIGDGACAFYRVSTLGGAARFVEGIASLLDAHDARPDIDIRHDGVTIRLLTRSDDYYGMTQRDADLARRISVAARSLELVADPSAVQSMIVIPGAWDVSKVMPFWRAVLGYQPRPDSPDEDLVDAHDRSPGFWFEGMQELRGDGGGAIHIAVWVPHDQARARVDAALAAGGRLVRDDFAPAWWTLADAAGNECDVATVMHRG